MCVYMHVCQEENKCCMVLDEGGKDSALILEKKKQKTQKGVQSKFHSSGEEQPDGSISC